MARTSEAAVKLIIDTNLTTAQVEQFIDDASLTVTTLLGGAGLGSSLLEQIERYLAADLICARDARLTSARMGDVQEGYQRDKQVSEYLRKAVGMDPTGTLEDRLMPTGRPKVSFRTAEGYDDQLDLPGESV